MTAAQTTQVQVAAKAAGHILPFRAPQRETITPAKLGIQSLISKGTIFHGDLESNAGMKVDGQIIGNLRINSNSSNADMPDAWLVIAEGAKIDGSVSARKVVICGNVVGTVKAHHVILLPTARIDGDIYYDILKMSEGARVAGSLHDGSGSWQEVISAEKVVVE